MTMPTPPASASSSSRPGRTPRRKPAPKPACKPRAGREFSAGFILFRESRGQPLFLLLDYGQHWDYPKGHLEKGESAWQAAVRELCEETGIRQVDRVTRFQRDMHYRFFSSKKGHVEKTVTYFLGRTRTEKVTLSDEHSGHVWLAYPQAFACLTFPNARHILTAAHQALLRHTSPRARRAAT